MRCVQLDGFYAIFPVWLSSHAESAFYDARSAKGHPGPYIHSPDPIQQRRAPQGQCRAVVGDQRRGHRSAFGQRDRIWYAAISHQVGSMLRPRCRSLAYGPRVSRGVEMRVLHSKRALLALRHTTYAMRIRGRRSIIRRRQRPG